MADPLNLNKGFLQGLSKEMRQYIKAHSPLLNKASLIGNAASAAVSGLGFGPLAIDGATQDRLADPELIGQNWGRFSDYRKQDYKQGIENYVKAAPGKLETLEKEIKENQNNQKKLIDSTPKNIQTLAEKMWGLYGGIPNGYLLPPTAGLTGKLEDAKEQLKDLDEQVEILGLNRLSLVENQTRTRLREKDIPNLEKQIKESEEELGKVSDSDLKAAQNYGGQYVALDSAIGGKEGEKFSVGYYAKEYKENPDKYIDAYDKPLRDVSQYLKDNPAARLVALRPDQETPYLLNLVKFNPKSPDVKLPENLVFSATLNPKEGDPLRQLRKQVPGSEPEVITQIPAGGSTKNESDEKTDSTASEVSKEPREEPEDVL